MTIPKIKLIYSRFLTFALPYSLIQIGGWIAIFENLHKEWTNIPMNFVMGAVSGFLSGICSFPFYIYHLINQSTFIAGWENKESIESLWKVHKSLKHGLIKEIGIAGLRGSMFGSIHLGMFYTILDYRTENPQA